MAQIDPRAQAVLAQARGGDIAGAIAAGERAVAEGLDDGPFLIFLGMLSARAGDLPGAIRHLERGVALVPGEVGAQVELGRAYLSAGDPAAAEALTRDLADPKTPMGRERLRIRARALLNLARAGDAQPLFDTLVAADAQDFESWDGLGSARLVTGDAEGSVAAATRAVSLRPTVAPYQLNLARSLAVVRRYEEAKAAVATARALAPPSEALLVEAGDILLQARAFTVAEQAFREALEHAPHSPIAWLGIARTLERLNRYDELLDVLDKAEQAGVASEPLVLLRAKGLRGLKRWDEALAMVQGAPEATDPVERLQLIGDLSDKTGQSDAAFAAFAEANGLIAAGTAAADRRAGDYLALFTKIRTLLTPESYARWRPLRVESDRRAPLFIFGFPRSGTTLIDTMLGGHPDAVVIEEEPTIDAVAREVMIERIPDLGDAEARRLIALYFAEADKYAPSAGDRLIVDKHPLGLGSAPLLFRLFPDARFVFVERHPCDVVLSCFITAGQMDAGVASFYSFEGTARLYDQVLAFWMRVREVLPIKLHTVRYETLIADPEAELRALATFAGLDWTPQMLANEANAAARAYIGSPSYAQVAEPIYTRAKGRWLRYRAQMEAVMPILRPWIERLGYTEN